MKRIVLCLVGLSLALVCLVSCAGRGETTFVHITDTQVGFIDESEHFVVSDSLFRDAVAAINVVKPSFVFITGDLVNDRKNAEQKEIFKARIADIDPSIGVYAVPGNHDIPKYDEETLAEYIDFIGYDRFSFTSGDCAFIGYNSSKALLGTAEDEAEEYGWLSGELAKAAGKRHVFVFFHCPLALESLDEPDQWDNFPTELRLKYSALFKKYSVEALFTGHTHAEFTADLDGVMSYVAGPVAKALGHGFPGLNIVHVTPDSLSVEFVSGRAVVDAACEAPEAAE